MRKIRIFFGFLFLLCVVLLVLPLISHGTPDQSEDRPNRLSVITYNTHRMGMFRKPRENEVIRYLLQQDADLVCLQEVEVYKDKQYLTLAELKQAFGQQYPYSYFDFAVYNERRQFGNVVFSKYPLIHKQTIRYPSRANISSRCDVVAGNDTLRLITNHLESNRFGRDDFEEMKQKYSVAHAARVEQAKCVRAEMDRSPYPLLVVGDFNDLPVSATYWHIRRWDMRDAFLSTSWGRYGATLVKGIFAVRIDYILCSRSIQPVECRVDKVEGSDHYPLRAVVTF